MTRATLRAEAFRLLALGFSKLAEAETQGETGAPDEYLSLDEARALARLRTARPIKDAGRRAELTLYGSERTRTVKRGEFLAWLESRKVVVAGADDADLERRVRRLRAVAGGR